MKKFYKINLPILLIISFFLHFILLSFWLIPDSGGMINFIERKKQLAAMDSRMSGARDIIVNINQDDKRVIDRNTLLSDRDSSAKGYITKEKGNRWLNNSLDFKLGQGKGKSAGKRKTGGNGKKQLDGAGDEEVHVTIMARYTSKSGELSSAMERLAIPDKNDVTRKNAIFYSNTGSFSFNTAKFKNFTYFRAMKDRISSNWYPPMVGNAHFGGYAPGRMRIMGIQSQIVKMYFIMDRTGEVVKIEILDSMGNTPLDSTCMDAIRLSKNFGKVPDDIEGEYILIPFIFEYISQ
ncbi:MAG TPA: TonB C-terminal domain-containing protein [Spirochaetota bacterium]|nr:TonB C-terminal domain-containing protein [Spirochaetota bacterium]